MNANTSSARTDPATVAVGATVVVVVVVVVEVVVVDVDVLVVEVDVVVGSMVDLADMLAAVIAVAVVAAEDSAGSSAAGAVSAVCCDDASSPVPLPLEPTTPATMVNPTSVVAPYAVQRFQRGCDRKRRHRFRWAGASPRPTGSGGGRSLRGLAPLDRRPSPGRDCWSSRPVSHRSKIARTALRRQLTRQNA
jgi:hypothetical protein